MCQHLDTCTLVCGNDTVVDYSIALIKQLYAGTTITGNDAVDYFGRSIYAADAIVSAGNSKSCEHVVSIPTAGKSYHGTLAAVDNGSRHDGRVIGVCLPDRQSFTFEINIFVMLINTRPDYYLIGVLRHH